jgi:membrane protein implicated in regulation of membrane protease activity
MDAYRSSKPLGDEASLPPRPTLRVAGGILALGALAISALAWIALGFGVWAAASAVPALMVVFVGLVRRVLELNDPRAAAKRRVAIEERARRNIESTR